MKAKKAKKNMPGKVADEGGMAKSSMSKPGGKSPPTKKKKAKY